MPELNPKGSGTAVEEAALGGAAAGEARPASAESYSEARAKLPVDLPAILEEGELPKGYERIVREDGGSHRFVTAEFLPDGTVFYIGRHSVKLEELDGKAFLSFPGISLEKQVGWRTGGDPPPRSVLSKDKIELLSRDRRLKIHGNCPTSISSDKIVLFKGFSYGSGDFKDKILPCVDEVLFPGHVQGENGQEIDFTDLGSGLFDGTKIEVRVDEIGAGYRETGKKIFQLDIDYFPVGGVAVRNKIIAIPIEQPSTAVVARPAGAGESFDEVGKGEVGARAGMGTGVALTEEPKVGERLAVVDREGRAGAEKPEEAELLLTEKVFAATVEDLVGWEEGVGAIDSGKLQKAFENIRSQFGKLSAGGRFRAKVMENVMSQLGAEGEKMRKANKKDEQIFEEWLKRVFIPLYRRIGKSGGER